MSTVESASDRITQDPDEPVVPLRHPGHWVAVAVIAVLAAMAVNFLAFNPKLRLDLVAGYLFERSVLRGLLLTIELTVIAMVVGIVLGIVLAVMRLSGNPVLRAVAGGTSGCSAAPR